MITETDRTIINECAKKYEIEKVILFGSALNSDNYNDIDIAVKCGNPRLFFKLYGELFRKLSKTIDIINLSESTLFNQMIENNGIIIYQ
jgi:predicted nucleotidyltransferase